MTVRAAATAPPIARRCANSISPLCHRPAAGIAPVIEGLWLQTGPYMNLLYPDYIGSPRGRRPARIIRALHAHDAATARREVENDIRRALSYVADLADHAGNIAPASPR